MCNRQRDAPRGAEDAGILGELVDEGSGLGVEAGRLGVDGLQALAGRHEEGAVHHHVPLRPPVPPGPRALLRVHPLRHLRNPRREKERRSEHLFGVGVGGGDVAVALAIDGGVGAASDGVHLPARVVVVDDVEVPVAAPRHPLHQLLAEVVEGDGHLHPRIRQVLVAVAQQHHLVVPREVAIRHRDRRRPHDRVHQPVRAVRQRAVVDPDAHRAVQRDAVAVGARAPAVVRRRGAHVGVARGDAVVDVDVVNDYVGDVLEGDAGAAGDVDVGAAAVEGLEAVDEELLVEADGHVGGEDDPEGALLDGGVAEGAGGGVDGVEVGGVGDDVERAALPAEGAAPEPDAAVRQPLPVRLPVHARAPPAVVDRVAREARRLRQRPPPRPLQLPAAPMQAAI
ncbi:hypothetical protein ACMD2_01918 [Ananas comosus]|uniref:Uncharacterized protein n=1 Tax=Ananas comosus TaxID=4615 RepID=A0A199UIS1_ANACO|nr:hypothetical protein ACMD2_01918 [Ananas comosus]